MPTKLRKVARTLFADRSGTDTSQVPIAVSSGIKVYKQGATVTTAGPTVIGSHTVVAVRDSGGLVVGDTVQKGSSATNTATVYEITSRTSIKLDSASGTLSLSIGDRILVTSNRPTLYTESSGNVGVGSSNVSTNAAGYGEFYTTTGVVDLIFSGTGITTATEYDVEAGYLMPKPWLDVRDFASLKEAYDAAPSTGAIIHIPAGTTCELSAALDVSKPVIFQGDGAVAGSIIRTSAADPNHHMFNVTTGAQFHGLEIDMRATVADDYDAIRVHGHGVNNIDLANFQMYDVYIHHTPRSGLRITEIIDSHFEKVLITNAYGDAYVIQQSSGSTDPVNGGYTATSNTNVVFIDCRASDCHKRGFYHDNSYRLNLIGCTFEALGEAAALGGAGGTTGTGALDGLVYIKNAVCPTIIGCHSEGAFTSATRAQQFWYLETISGGVFTGNAIELIGGDTGSQLKCTYGVLFQSSGDTLISGNRILGFNTQGLAVAADCHRMVVQQPNYGTTTDRMLMSSVDSMIIGGHGMKVTEFADTTARDHATTGAVAMNGNICYVASTGKFYGYQGGAWVTFGAMT